MSPLLKSTFVPAILVTVFGYVIYEALGQSLQAKLFPMTVGIIGFVLVFIQLVREVQKALKASRTGTAATVDTAGMSDFAVTDVEKTSAGRMRAAEQFAWLTGLLIGLWLLGFYIGVPMMVALYLLRHRERPVIVVGLTAGIALMVWGVFNQLLNLPFPEGLILEWLGV